MRHFGLIKEAVEEIIISAGWEVTSSPTMVIQ